MCDATSCPSKSVPRLDLSSYIHGNPQERAQFCADLVDTFEHCGFAKLVNHGISASEIQEAFFWNQRFFKLPLDAKMKAAHPAQPNPHRGYSYVGQEKLSMVKDYEKGDRQSEVVHDIKESFDQGHGDDNLYPNQWPEEFEIPGFRDFMESFYLRCHQMHLMLLEAIEIGLSLPVGFLQKMCEDNTSELRLNHYPACSAKAIHAGAKRISEHTDFGTVTLLFQDSVGGLEVEDQAQHGSYIPVEHGDVSEMIVNIGDCLQRWTNDKLKSASHRVVIPPGMNNPEAWLNDRYSIAYFAKPNRSQHVGCLAEFVNEGVTPKYDRITAWKYNQDKLVLTY